MHGFFPSGFCPALAAPLARASCAASQERHHRSKSEAFRAKQEHHPREPALHLSLQGMEDFTNAHLDCAEGESLHEFGYAR